MLERVDAISAAAREQLIDGILRTLSDRYVFPEIAARIEVAIRERAGRGEYASITDATQLAAVLTRDLREAGEDQHLGLYFSPEPRPLWPEGVPPPDEIERFDRDAAFLNYGFRTVERLAGNLGYLRLDEFFPATDHGAATTAGAAMTFLARTSALIIDLCHNRGGDPTMTGLLAGHLFAEPVHTSTFRWRGEDTEYQNWTPAHVPGPRYLDHPVYLLLSPETASAAEEFAYALRQLDRVTLVGETTAGAAYGTLITRLDAHFDFSVPQGYPVHPKTGTNWQDVGVAPDIPARSQAALPTAQRLALAHVIEWAAERDFRGLADEARAALKDLNHDASA